TRVCNSGREYDIEASTSTSRVTLAATRPSKPAAARRSLVELKRRNVDPVPVVSVASRDPSDCTPFHDNPAVSSRRPGTGPVGCALTALARRTVTTATITVLARLTCD